MIFSGINCLDPTEAMAEALSKAIGKKGSVIAWNMSFEAGCNREWLEDVQVIIIFYRHKRRMIDLMDSFKKGYYVNRLFQNSASLKKVLPVLAPKLSYKELNIQEGNTASNSWRLMVDPSTKKEKAKQIYDDLIKYCGTDTLAMVEILGVLEKVI